MNLNKPNSKYDHVFAVVRMDNLGPENTFGPNAVVVTKVFLSQEPAEAEADRLNNLNGDKDTIYFVRVTRMEVK